MRWDDVLDFVFELIRRVVPVPEKRDLNWLIQCTAVAICGTLIVVAGKDVIPIAVNWLFGRDMLPDNAPVIGFMYWMHQHPIVPFVLGAVVLTLGLLRLAKTWKNIAILLIVSIIAAVAFQFWPFWPRQTPFPPQQPTATIAVSPTPTRIPPTPTRGATSTQNLLYTATVPGPGCAPDRDLWQARGTAGTTTCTSGGMDLSVAAGLSFGEVAFDPRQLQGVGSLTTYCVKTTAVFEESSAGAAILIGVHGQNPGGQVAQFFQNGDLAILRFLHSTGAPDSGPPLAKTTFHASSPYHLAVGVDGSAIRVWVNEQPVATASDATYSTTEYVFIGLKADTTLSPAKPAEAVFSDFVFQAGTLDGCGS